MSHLILREDYVNATKGWGIGDSEIALEDSIIETKADLYRYGLREYGRCTGKVYVDTESGPKAVGYVFQARVKYEDADETYLREVWITLMERQPAVTTSVGLEVLA